MFREMPMGYELQDSDHLVFFGKKHCTLEYLQKQYPQIQFRSVRQTHSDKVILSQLNSADIEADAHYTTEQNVGLLIKTADCLPILIYSPGNQIIAAVHAGWRGVENQITLKTLRKLPLNDDYKIYIGPHILQDSFEVKEDVKDLLLKSACKPISQVAFQKAESYYVSLQKIVQSQINDHLPQAQVFLSQADTYRNPLFNSFRTDATKQRNLSFVAQKTSPV